MANNKRKSKRNNRSNKRNKCKSKNIDSTKQAASNFTEEEQNTKNIQDEQHEVNSGDETRKREHTEDSDSEAEDTPKKKKKKNKPVAEPTVDKKSKKSIRQMKREKHEQRLAEAQAASKDQLKSECLNYLSQWKHDKQNWKFMKAKQGWLFKNKFSATIMPDESWPLLLEYFEAAKGNIRNLLLEDANKIIKQQDDWLEAQTGKDKKANEDEDDENENLDGPQKPDDTSYKRARDLIQCLEE